jgi:superoxide dismutase, Fe-Mn family
VAYAPSVAIPSGTFRLGPRNGTLSVRTGRVGAVAKVGHDLLLQATAWEGTLEVGEDRVGIELDVDATSLRVREGKGGMQELADEDYANIEQTINDEVLTGRTIAFRSTEVQVSDDGRLGIRGDLTLGDETHPITFDLVLDGSGRLKGRALVKQSSWGITPYSALFGALQVADEVTVEIDTGLPTSVELWMSMQELKPRGLKPELLELEGISRESIMAQYRLYAGHVDKRNEILRRLAEADLAGANPVYSELRALKVELSFALGGIKNLELYFEQLGGDGGNPRGAVAALIKRDFGSAEMWHSDLKATAMAARGWAWTAYDWDEGRLFNYLGDGDNSYAIWNATPLLALDVHEHAYYLDFQTDREAYVDAFFANVDWSVVNGWVSKHHIPLPHRQRR